MIITIDGPTASGKSTIGRMLAKQLEYYYLYSGLLYRALAYVLKTDYGYTKEQFAHPRTEDIQAALDAARFVYRYDQYKGEQVFFDGNDITQFLKEKSIDQFASLISLHELVRARLLEWQRDIAKSADVIVDGRDSGSVVFPSAEYKFYITASEDERARRWHQQQTQKGLDISFEQARAFIAERDQRDTQRAHSPLIIPEGAQVIDNTDQSHQETLDAMLRTIKA